MTDYIPVWFEIRKFGNNKFLRSSYYWIILVPIIATAFSKINEIELDVTLFNKLFKFQFYLPFKWYLFYFGALFHALGISIYQIFCPSLLKQYSNFTSFEKDGNGQEALNAHLAKILQQKKSFSTLYQPDNSAMDVIQTYIKKFGKDGIQADVDGIRRRHGDNIEQVMNVIGIKEEQLKDAYYFILRLANQTHPVFRAISSISFGTGLFLFLIVIAQGTISVIKLLNP